MLRYFYILLLSACISSAYAQGTFKGKVFENQTRIGLANVWVENLNSKRNALTDKTGKFSIPAKIGDLVLFKGFAYQNDTVLVTNLSSTEVFLQPKQIQLNEVNIVNTEITKPLLNYDPQFHNQTVVYHRDAKGAYDGGLTFRIWYWKKGEKDKARLEKKLHDFNMMDRIRDVFTPQTVGKFVPLTGEELDNFIALYTPNVKIFSAKDFNMITYLSDSYKSYLALPPDKRIPQPLVK